MVPSVRPEHPVYGNEYFTDTLYGNSSTRPGLRPDVSHSALVGGDGLSDQYPASSEPDRLCQTENSAPGSASGPK